MNQKEMNDAIDARCLAHGYSISIQDRLAMHRCIGDWRIETLIDTLEALGQDLPTVPALVQLARDRWRWRLVTSAGKMKNMETALVHLPVGSTVERQDWWSASKHAMSPQVQQIRMVRHDGSVVRVLDSSILHELVSRRYRKVRESIDSMPPSADAVQEIVARVAERQEIEM